MEELVIQRVNQLMLNFKMRIGEFSDAIGIPKSTVSQQLNGKKGDGRGVKSNVILAILSAFPNVSAEWLLRGEGSMFRNSGVDERPGNNGIVEILQENISLLKFKVAVFEKRVAELEGEKEASQNRLNLPLDAKAIVTDGGEKVSEKANC